jgi:hypothetical protein
MSYTREELEQIAQSVPFWWHSIDLGHGVVTNGFKSVEVLKHELKALRLPDLRGKTVLDIGAYDGFFSFEAERCGAERMVALDHYVWALDLPKAIAYWRECNERGIPVDPEAYASRLYPEELPGMLAPNEKAVAGMCRAAGFSRVEVVVGSPLPSPSRRSAIAELRSSVGAVLRKLGLREKLAEVIRYRAIVYAWK